MLCLFCWFPVIGLVIGLVELAVFYILTKWQVGSVFRGLPDGGAFIGDRRHSSGWIYGYNGCQKFLWGQGKKTDDPGKIPCGGLCGDRLCFYLILSVGAWSEIDAKGYCDDHGFCSGTGIQRIGCG